MKKGRVLVTGGAGYIGTHTAVELIAAGYEVVLLDDLSNADESAVEAVRKITGQKVPFERMDCCDKVAMEKLFGRYEFIGAIHFAAHKAVGESVQQPVKYYANNITSFTTLLEMMGKHGVNYVLFSSSATVYGETTELPVTEKSPRKPATSPYGNTKQIGEDILRDTIAAEVGMRGISLRYFNPIGAHRSTLIGEEPRGVPNNLVPFIVQTAAGVRGELSVFGDDYNTPDGSALRDYIDVVDLAKAHVAALSRMTQGKAESRYEIFNIGTGKPVSVLELIEEFKKVNNVDVPYKIVGRRDGDVEAIWADTSLAERVLGWRAEYSLAESLKSAWDYYSHSNTKK